MTTTDIQFVAGTFRLLIAVLDSDGVWMGQSLTPNSPTANTDYPAYLVNHPVSVSSGDATYVVATDFGGQSWRGDMNLGLQKPGQLTLTLSDYDHVFDGIISGSYPAKNVNSGWSRGGRDDMKANPPRVGIIAFSAKSSRDAATYGELGYIAWYRSGILRSKDPEQNQSGGENPSALTYTMDLQPIRAEPTGVLLSAVTGLTYTDNETVTYPMDAGEYMFNVHTWIANGAATTFTLDTLPVYSDASATGRNLIAKNGVAIAVTSINTTTGLVTIASAGSSGDVWSVAYPTSFI